MTHLSPAERIQFPRGEGTFSYFRYGDKGGKPVLAIHGVTSSNLAWQFLAARLVKDGYTLYAPDLRGRGDSNTVGAPYGMRVHADDMAALLDHADVESAHVIGHSMGAFVAAAFAHLHPKRVAKLSFIDGGVPLALPPGMTVEQVLPLVLGPALSRLSMQFESVEAYAEYWKPHPAFAQRGWNDALQAYVEHDLQGEPPHMHPSTTADAVTRDSEDLWSGDFIANALKALEQPVTMLRAERGLQNEEMALYPPVVFPYIAENFPKISVVTVEDTNHYDIVMSDFGADAIVQHLF